MLSIIIPMYNVADMLDRCIDSIAAAVHPPEPIQLVFVNDASPTGAKEAEIIEDHREELEGYGMDIIVVNHKYNKGLAASRNTGLKYSRGEWIIWLDSDDAITKNGIMDRWVWRNPEEFHYGSYDVINYNDAEEKLFERRILPPFTYGNHFSKNIMPVWTGILHRSKVLQFNELYRVAEDYDMTLRMALEMPFVSHPEIVVKYTWARAASLTFDSFWGNHMPSSVHESKRKCLSRVINHEYSLHADAVNKITDFRKQVTSG